MKSKITIKATPNYKDKTYTIRKYNNGKVYVKYRTTKMSNNMDITWTENDWQQFLNKCIGEYYEVKRYRW